MSIVFTYFVPSTPNDGFSMWEKNSETPNLDDFFFFKFGVSYNLFVPCFLGCV